MATAVALKRDYGLDEDGIFDKPEVVSAKVAKSHKVSCDLRLAAKNGRWFFGYSFEILGLARTSIPVTEAFGFETRGAALLAAIERAEGWFTAERGTSAKITKACDAVLAALRVIRQKVEAGENSGRGGRNAKPLPHPGTTSSSTPARIASHDPDAVGFTDDPPASIDPAASTDESPARLEVIPIPIDRIDRHPKNRVPKEAAIAAVMDSLSRNGQLEAIVVRAIGKRWQLVSGETRWLAAGRLGWTELVGRSIDVGDAEALRMVASYNADRTDLDPIQRAILIQALCEPVEAGGSGLTREAAAKEVGLESHSAAANLVRLLELPEVWQERVASGELPQTFARELLALVPAPKLIDKANEAWADEDFSWCFESRSNIEELVQTILKDGTRPIDDAMTSYYGWNEVRNLSGYYSRKFDLTDKIREKLDIRTLTIDGKQVEVATNIKAFDKLQIPAIKKAAEEKAKNRAAEDTTPKSAKSKQPKPELTPAQVREKKKEAAGKLKKRVEIWRHKWLRGLIAESLEDSWDVILRLSTWLLANPLRPYADADMHEIFRRACSSRGDSQDKESLWKPIASMSDSELESVRREVVRGLLLAENKNSDDPILPTKIVDSLAVEIPLDLTREWYRLQEREDQTELIEFYGLHSGEQLADLAREINAKLSGSSKAEKVQSLVEQQVNVPKKTIRDWGK